MIFLHLAGCRRVCLQVSLYVHHLAVQERQVRVRLKLSTIPPSYCARFVYTAIWRLFVFCACFLHCLKTHFHEHDTLCVAKEGFVIWE